jgi:hypothetical protein
MVWVFYLYVIKKVASNLCVTKKLAHTYVPNFFALQAIPSTVC